MTEPPYKVQCERLQGGRIAALTLNHPERKNALGPAEWQALAGYLGDIAADPTVRVVLLRGAGGAFSAGGDLRSMPERLEWPVMARRQQLLRDAEVPILLYELDLPVVAEISGPCMGAGLSLALACDLRIAADTASFGAVFHRVGLSADFGLSWLLPRAVGQARASELLFTACTIDAARACELGIVQRVVAADHLAEETLKLCYSLADGPKLAQMVSKRALRHAERCDLRQAVEWEAHSQTLLGKTADAQEGVAAFLAKRSPRFRGE